MNGINNIKDKLNAIKNQIKAGGNTNVTSATNNRSPIKPQDNIKHSNLSSNQMKIDKDNKNKQVKSFDSNKNHQSNNKKATQSQVKLISEKDFLNKKRARKEAEQNYNEEEESEDESYSVYLNLC